MTRMSECRLYGMTPGPGLLCLLCVNVSGEDVAMSSVWYCHMVRGMFQCPLYGTVTWSEGCSNVLCMVLSHGQGDDCHVLCMVLSHGQRDVVNVLCMVLHCHMVRVMLQCPLYGTVTWSEGCCQCNLYGTVTWSEGCCQCNLYGTVTCRGRG